MTNTSKIGEIVLPLRCSYFIGSQTTLIISMSVFTFKYGSKISGRFAVTVSQFFSSFETELTNILILSSVSLKNLSSTEFCDK